MPPTKRRAEEELSSKSKAQKTSALLAENNNSRAHATKSPNASRKVLGDYDFNDRISSSRGGIASEEEESNDEEEYTDDEDFAGLGEDYGDDEDDAYDEILTTTQTYTTGGDNSKTIGIEISARFMDDCVGWMTTISATASYKGKRIGTATSQYIRRDRIRASFYQAMEEPTQDTAKLAFGLFDRWGFLKDEFVSHCVRKCSGVFEHELSWGNFLLIEDVLVDKAWRRQGLGRAIAQALIEFAKDGQDNYLLNEPIEFAFLEAGFLSADTCDSELDGLSPEEALALENRKYHGITTFWRNVGFRRVGASNWFGLPMNDHEALNLQADHDFNPTRISRLPDESEFPFHNAAFSLHDIACREFLVGKLASGEMIVGDLKPPDYAENTVLHIAAKLRKLETVKWLLENDDVDRSLSLARNNDGWTALEAVQAELRSQRATLDIGCGLGDFQGFDPESVQCLALLECMKEPTLETLKRLKYGCSCGKCQGGFLSVGMGENILDICEPIVNLFSLSKTMIEFSRKDCERILKAVTFDQPIHLRTMLLQDKLLQQGFANVVRLVSECCCDFILPSKTNVLANLEEITFEEKNERSNSRTSSIMLPEHWTPLTRSFLEKGGTIEGVLRAVLREMQYADLQTCGGELCMSLSELKKTAADAWGYRPCNNDTEYEFVVEMLLKSPENLPSKSSGSPPAEQENEVDETKETLLHQVQTLSDRECSTALHYKQFGSSAPFCGDQWKALDDSGGNLLHIAAGRGMRETVELLLELEDIFEDKHGFERKFLSSGHNKDGFMPLRIS